MKTTMMHRRHIRLDVFCDALIRVAANARHTDDTRAAVAEFILLANSRPDAHDIVQHIVARNLGIEDAIRELRLPRLVA